MPRRIVTVSLDESLVAQVDALRGGMVSRSRIFEFVLAGGLERVGPALEGLRRVEKALRESDR